MIENEPKLPGNSPKLILALVGVAVLGIVFLISTLWNMSPEIRLRQMTTILMVMVAALFIGYFFDRRNKSKRPRIIIRFPSRR
jgi:L-asparagine transporter-like permease